MLAPATNRIRLEPEKTYAQITARLWGKGLTLRGRLKGSEIAADQQTCVAAGQLLLSKIDARHGAFGIVPEQLAGAVVSNDFPAFDISADQATPEYLAWVGRTEWLVELCRRASEGSTNRVRLKEARFLAQTIPLHRSTRSGGSWRGWMRRRKLFRRGGVGPTRWQPRSPPPSAPPSPASPPTPPAPAWATSPPLVRPVAIDPEATYSEIGVRSFYRGLFTRRMVKGEAFDWQKLY